MRTLFGPGSVRELRGDGVVVVTLSDWRLADGKSPLLFLQPASVTKIDLVAEKLKRGAALKTAAAVRYGAGDWSGALDAYLEAVQEIRYLGDNLRNEERAAVFMQTVACYNNIALCCLNLEKHGDGVTFARNSLLLIEALERRMAQDSEVWRCLEAQHSMTEAKLKEWKRKSCFYLGKGELLRKNFELAVQYLEAAVSMGYKTELLRQAKVSLKAERQAAQKTWKKAFEANSKEPEEPAPIPAAAPESKSPAAPAATAASATAAAPSSSRRLVSVGGLDGVVVDLGQAGLDDGTVAAQGDDAMYAWAGLFAAAGVVAAALVGLTLLRPNTGRNLLSQWLRPLGLGWR